MSVIITNIQSWQTGLTTTSAITNDSNAVGSDIANASGYPYIQLEFTPGTASGITTGGYVGVAFPALLSSGSWNGNASNYEKWDNIEVVQLKMYTYSASTVHPVLVDKDKNGNRIAVPPGTFRMKVLNKTGGTLSGTTTLKYRLYSLGDSA